MLQMETFSVLIWQTIFIFQPYAYPGQSLSRISFFLPAVTLKYFKIYKSFNAAYPYFLSNKITGTSIFIPLS